MTPFRLRRHMKYLPVVALAAGGLMFLPGNENARPTPAFSAKEPPARPSYLARLPAPVDETLTTGSIATVETDTRPLAGAEEAPAMHVTASLPESVETPQLTVPQLNQQPAAGFFVRAALGPDALDGTPLDGEETGETMANARVAHATTAVNVRAGPSSSTAKLFVLQQGEAVEALGEDGGWIEVATPDGSTGWVYSRYLEVGAAGDARVAETTGPAEQQAVEEEPEPVEVASAAPEEREPEFEGRSARMGGDVALRAGPSRGSARLFTLERGERVQIAETRGDWVRVVLRSGVSGWVKIR